MALDLKPVFDASVFIAYGAPIEEEILSSLVPSVVLFELVATSLDKSLFQKYAALRIALEKKSQILTPSASDWWETSKVVRNLYLRSGEQASKVKTLRNDALIARLAVQNKGYVVTVDVDDFQIIKKEVKDLQIMAATKFFGF